MFTAPMKVYALAATIVGLHMLILALWTGTVRTRKKVFVNPEDAKISNGTTAESDHPDVLRVKRAHQNLLENAIPFFGIGLLFAATNPSVNAARVYCFTFVGARLLHTVFYLLGKQPFRTLMFATGVLTTFGMAYHVLRAALG